MSYLKITISGKICTGKTTLLKHLGEKLGWPVFMTGQLFREYASKQGLNLEGAEEQNERLTKEVDEKVKTMLHDQVNLIVDGWMSGISANQQPDVLKILLVCNDVTRYKRFAEREQIDLDTAKKRVEERQKNWFDKMKKIHNIDPQEFTDEKNYDLIIDTSLLEPYTVTDKVLAALK